MLNPIALAELVKNALLEDIGPGDITTEATVPATTQAMAVLFVKEEGVVCGHPAAQAAFQLFDPTLSYETLVPEGSWVEEGTKIARITGPARSILTAER